MVSIQVTSNLHYMVRIGAELEMNLVALERMMEFDEQPKEVKP